MLKVTLSLYFSVIVVQQLHCLLKGPVYQIKQVRGVLHKTRIKKSRIIGLNSG